MDHLNNSHSSDRSSGHGGEYFRRYVERQQYLYEAARWAYIRQQDMSLIERTREQHFAETLDLEHPLPVKPSTITFHTDTGRKIERDICPEELAANPTISIEAANDYLKAFGFLTEDGIENKVRIIEHANPRYNCHGYTFTHGEAGHIGILNHENDIEAILTDKNYRDCDDARPPQRGDIVIYRNSNNQICHSGVISRIDGDKISAISKWSLRT